MDVLAAYVFSHRPPQPCSWSKVDQSDENPESACFSFRIFSSKKEELLLSRSKITATECSFCRFERVILFCASLKLHSWSFKCCAVNFAMFYVVLSGCVSLGSHGTYRVPSVISTWLILSQTSCSRMSLSSCRPRFSKLLLSMESFVSGRDSKSYTQLSRLSVIRFSTFAIID